MPVCEDWSFLHVFVTHEEGDEQNFKSLIILYIRNFYYICKVAGGLPDVRECSASKVLHYGGEPCRIAVT